MTLFDGVCCLVINRGLNVYLVWRREQYYNERDRDC